MGSLSYLGNIVKGFLTLCIVCILGDNILLELLCQKVYIPLLYIYTFTNMPKKKKTQNINIKSSETKIFFGLILLVLGMSLLIAPFVGQQAEIFVHISTLLGWPSALWGVALLLISLELLTKKGLKNWTRLIGVSILALTLNILFTFWLPREVLELTEELQRAGGIVGKTFHLALNNTFGNIIELVILLILLIIAFSLITGVKLEEITAFLQQMFGNIKFGNLKDRLDRKNSGEKLIISGLDDTQQGLQNANINENNEISVVSHSSEQVENMSSRQNISPVKIPVSTTDPTQDMPTTPQYSNWIYPKIDNLQEPQRAAQNQEAYKNDSLVIERVLKNFGITAKAVKVEIGPTVVRYALSLAADTRVTKIKGLIDNLAVSLMINEKLIRIETPIPGTSYIGIEIPNKTPNFVYAKEMARKLLNEADKYELPMILGKDVTGQSVIRDLTNIPHLLVAGATNTGKSVGLNSILAGLLLTKTPDELKLIMVDPKRVEMAPYNGIPHLLTPIITEMDLVVNALDWTIAKMMKRYKMFEQQEVRKISEYNQKMGYIAMPYIVIVVDEMADLMLVAGKQVEPKIQRLAQMGRATGIHLILATQKPIVEVITGLIKSNIPGRMAFAVMQGTDSRVILDENGAENLRGSGDMLYKDITMAKPIRVQGTFITTKETQDIVSQVKAQLDGESPIYSDDLKNAIENPSSSSTISSQEREPEFKMALEIVIAEGKASASLLQKRLRIGYGKASRIMDQLEQAGAIGKARDNSSKARDVLVSSSEEVLGREDDTQQ